jgi:hypothetical protein
MQIAEARFYAINIIWKSRFWFCRGKKAPAVLNQPILGITASAILSKGY